MVALLKEFYGRGPSRAKSYYEDDLVVCVLRGGFSRVEQTLLDGAAAAVEQRLLHSREAATQHADHQIVLVVRLRAARPATVELLQQRDHPVGDRGQHIAVVLRLDLEFRWNHSALKML